MGAGGRGGDRLAPAAGKGGQGRGEVLNKGWAGAQSWWHFVAGRKVRERGVDCLAVDIVLQVNVLVGPYWHVHSDVQDSMWSGRSHLPGQRGHPLLVSFSCIACDFAFPAFPQSGTPVKMSFCSSLATDQGKRNPTRAGGQWGAFTRILLLQPSNTTTL